MKKVISAIIIALTIGTIGAIRASSANANSAGPFDTWDNNGVVPTYALHAHAENGVVTVDNTAGTIQDWDTILDGQYFQIKIHDNNNYCVNWHSSDDKFWLNSCNATNTDQQFTLLGDGVTGGYWFINRSCSAIDGQNGFATASANGSNQVVDCETAGAGGRAAWRFFSS